MAKTVEELVVLSSTLRDSIFELRLTKAELFMVMGLLGEMVRARANHVTSTAPALPTQEAKPVKEKVKDVPYNGPYDPPPPMTSEPLPPPAEEVRGKVLKGSGEACACAACGKIGYMTNAQIIDGMKVDDFINAFTAMEGYPSITRKIEIQNIDGNISTDCPRCKAQKKLYLVGREPAHESGVTI